MNILQKLILLTTMFLTLLISSESDDIEKVKKDVSNLRHVKQTENVIKAAIDTHAYKAIYYIKNLTEDLQLYALKKDIWYSSQALQTKTLSEKVQLFMIEKWAAAF